MYVCLCHAVTDQQIEKAVRKGSVSSVRDLQQTLGVGTTCGKCACEARDILQAASRKIEEPGLLASAIATWSPSVVPGNTGNDAQPAL
ncbi:MAG: bacterioferritin-associated ferredoxin [Natronospirillum sp.]|uniref:bacterioferritin-associated ferredoxin n=1 Tax=Natronospirillum sp. TaxID=2812955 RepID=UPI0025D5365D|nr:bacterioferritin-associated ferredoxin [Natronospirillum sp.]MCH8550446.1 bacterioferritin-associated ferredoxin [Natronospirillum sp.]